MSTVLEHSDAKISIEELPDDRRRVRVVPFDEQFPVSRKECETAYPLALIELILDVRGPTDLCDEISRDEDPKYVRKDLETDLLAFVNRRYFDGKRILDFGCGCGSSISILARMFPKAEIVGVELSDDYLSIARSRMRFYGFRNVSLHQSPNGAELPEGIGEFDAVIMSAVFEHLLPKEREILLPKIWSLLREGGHLFIGQTPNSLFPVEGHTTGFPLINYVPDRIALEATRRINVKASKRYEQNVSWEELLREGIRGGTEKEILNLLRKDKIHSPVPLKPRNFGFRDHADLWYSVSSGRGKVRAKQTLKTAIKLARATTGLNLAPTLSLAIKKSPAKT